MASVAPSPALLNVKLTAEKVELEQQLRAQASEMRGVRQKNAELVDLVDVLSKTQVQLKAVIEHLLAGRRRHGQLIDPSQSLLFAEQAAQLVDAIEALATGEPEGSAEIKLEDSETPDGESPKDPAPKPKPKPADRSRRVLDESNLRVEINRSELPLEERRCPVTGVELVEIGTKVTRELD